MDAAAGVIHADRDPLRVYVVTLRRAAGLTQEDVASRLEIGYRTYIAWESGETKDLKLPIARALMRVIGGAFKHLEYIEDLSAEEARDLAETWAKLSPEERATAEQAASKLDRIIQLSADDPIKLERVLRRIRAEAKEDQDLITLINGYLDGYQAAQRGQGEK